jgi:hypothetical protein
MSAFSKIMSAFSKIKSAFSKISTLNFGGNGTPYRCSWFYH